MKIVEKTDERLSVIINIIDEVFINLRQPSLLENNAFFINQELQFTHYLKFEQVNRQRNQVALLFELSNVGATFYVDRANEIIDWSYEMIQMDKAKFKQEIADLFTSFIVVEHKGETTLLRMFNKQGEQIRRYKYIQGLMPSFFFKSQFTLYQPYFELE